MSAPGAAAVHEQASRPDFRERVMALVGSSTWREPIGGRATDGDHTPSAHAIAAALAMARQGPGDLGPDIVIACALGNDWKRALIVRELANALAHRHNYRNHRALRRNYQHIGAIAAAAYDLAVHHQHRARLPRISPDDWDTLVAAGAQALLATGDATLAEAEKRWRYE